MKLVLIGLIAAVLVAGLYFSNEPEFKTLSEQPSAGMGNVEVTTIDTVPYESKYLEVLGSRIHYVDEGTGDPILFLHGNPTSLYLWRNIMPHLEDDGRIIAIDLIGMGKSDKPNIDYTYADHYRYLEVFIEKLDLQNITLVVHDWGSGLGFNYAALNEENIKGIVFMEALTRPFDSWDSVAESERQLLQRIRTEKIGEELVLNQNVFIEKLLPNSIVTRQLSETELDAYRQPFPTSESRKPILMWPRQIPIEGEPADVNSIVSNYYSWLQHTDIPKLMLTVSPGVVITPSVAEELEEVLPNLTTVHLGPGKHFIQEDYPDAIGNVIVEWYLKIGEE